MADINAVERVHEAAYFDPEVTVTPRVDVEAAIDRVLANPTGATLEDWQAVRDAVPEAFGEEEGDR